MPNWYNSRKAAQIAAFFALKEGGSIAVLKAVKLIYLADRNFMKAYDSSMLRDELVSMDHGPVNSITLNQINGMEAGRQEWSEFITDRSNYRISVATKGLTTDELDELSRAEIKVLEATWAEHGHLDKWAIRDFTHDNCAEWENPHGSSSPIPYSRVFKALGKPNPEELERRVLEERALEQAFSS